MKNAAYWQRRYKAIEELTASAGEVAFRDIERMFTSAQRDLENQIAGWYTRFAANNDLNLAEGKRLLNSGQLAEFRWDVNQYIDYARNNTVSERFSRQLENASARFHISRLEALKLQTQNTLERLFGNQLDAVDSLLKRQYLDNYYHSIFEVQKGFNVGWDIAAIPESQLHAVMNKPWTLDGRTFSDRIWSDKVKLVNEVHTQLTQGLITGRPPNEMIADIVKTLNTSKHNAARLIMTESAAFAAQAHEVAYRELGVESVQVLATLDSKTSEICRTMDGEIVRMADYRAGITVPPFHPWCRSTTIPYFDDDYGERAARDEESKTHYVPSDMKYPDWKANYVDKTIQPLAASTPTSWQFSDHSGKYSKQEAIDHLKAEYGIDFSDSKKYPVNEGVLSDMVGWMDSFTANYTDFAQLNPVQIPKIDIMPPSKIGKYTNGHYMYARNSPNAVEIALNGASHSNTLIMDAQIQRSVTSSWSVANKGRTGTFVHEYGHHVSNSMRWITQDMNWQQNFLDSVISEFKTANPNISINGFKDLGSHVSRYATTSYCELFAEAFAEYFGGENPREFTLTFGRNLEAVLKGVK